MKQTDNQLIENLVNDLKPGRQWPPLSRGLWWLAITVVFNVVAMLAYQPFRPGFVNQLLAYPRFSLEIAFAITLTFSLVYFLFTQLVPGWKRPTWLPVVFTGSLLGLIVTLYLSFHMSAPEASRLGARAYCVEELLVYSLMAMGFASYFIRKADLPWTWQNKVATGLACGLVPGWLMQLSCMYSPTHGLLIHYLPSVVIALLALGLIPLMARKSKKKI